MSGIRPPDCSKLAKNPKNDNDVTIFRHDVNVKFFWRCFVSLVKFSYWSKFHVNIITGSGIITIFFYKGLTRNPEIRNTLVWVLSDILWLDRIMDTNFGTNVSKMVLNAVKIQSYSFYRFWVIKGKPTGKEGGGYPTPPRLGLRNILNLRCLNRSQKKKQKTKRKYQSQKYFRSSCSEIFREIQNNNKKIRYVMFALRFALSNKLIERIRSCLCLCEWLLL